MVIIVIYINNFLVFRLDKSEIDNIKWWLNTNYKMKDLETCRQFLGMKVEQDQDRRISILQTAFINKAFMAAKMQDCKGVNALMIGSPNFPQNTKPPTNQELVQLYQSHIGSQMWAYIYTRPDLGFLF